MPHPTSSDTPSSSPFFTLRKVGSARKSTLKTAPAIANFVSVSLHVTDLDASLSFFKSLFQWSILRHEEYDHKDSTGEGIHNGSYSITYVGPSPSTFSIALIYNYGVSTPHDTSVHHIAISCHVDTILECAKQHGYLITQQHGDTCIAMKGESYAFNLIPVEGEQQEKGKIVYVSLYTKSLIRSRDYYTTILSMSDSEIPCHTKFHPDVKHVMLGYDSSQVQLQLVQVMDSMEMAESRERLIFTWKDVSTISSKLRSTHHNISQQDGYIISRDKDGYVMICINDKEWYENMGKGQIKMDEQERSRRLEQTRAYIRNNPAPIPNPVPIHPKASMPEPISLKQVSTSARIPDPVPIRRVSDPVSSKSTADPIPHPVPMRRASAPMPDPIPIRRSPTPSTSVSSISHKSWPSTTTTSPSPSSESSLKSSPSDINSSISVVSSSSSSNSSTTIATSSMPKSFSSSSLKIPNGRINLAVLNHTECIKQIDEYHTACESLQEQLLATKNELKLVHEKVRLKMEQLREILQFKEDEAMQLRNQLIQNKLTPCIQQVSMATLMTTPTQQIRKLSQDGGALINARVPTPSPSPAPLERAATPTTGSRAPTPNQTSPPSDIRVPTPSTSPPTLQRAASRVPTPSMTPPPLSRAISTPTHNIDYERKATPSQLIKQFNAPKPTPAPIHPPTTTSHVIKQVCDKARTPSRNLPTSPVSPVSSDSPDSPGEITMPRIIEAV